MTKKYVVTIDKDIKEIVPNFIANRENDLLQLQKYINENQYEEIKVIGHKLSGNAPSYGFDYLGKIGHELEISAEQKKHEEIINCIENFNEFMSNYEIKYE